MDYRIFSEKITLWTTHSLGGTEKEMRWYHKKMF
jgi:hypothetical protein